MCVQMLWKGVGLFKKSRENTLHRFAFHPGILNLTKASSLLGLAYGCLQKKYERMKNGNKVNNMLLIPSSSDSALQVENGWWICGDRAAQGSAILFAV